jgi:mannose-1-phosphate guanylyltransferase/mannose-1-phosphate guanylyltransferase/mannose-6-phosphate isomerase
MDSRQENNAQIHPVILSGGAGTRLWPMSREAYPKQLLALASERSLLQDTVARVTGARFAAPLIVCNAEHRFVIAEQLRQSAVAPSAIVLEPVGRNTAPAVAVAAMMLAAEDPHALMLVLPSDHVIGDVAAFRDAVDTAARAAARGRLVMFGIAPTVAEIGYGYVERGAALAGVEGAFAVKGFVEKPDLERARQFLAGGRHAWNGGMFLFPASLYLAELERLDPGMVKLSRAALEGATGDLDFTRLAAEPFGKIIGRSIDYAVMEHTDKAAVVQAAFRWSDVGSWSSLWDIAERDANDNAMLGDVIAVDATDSYLRSEGRLLAAVGIRGLVVVATEDAVLVLPKERAQDVRRIADVLKQQGRAELGLHPRVYRPWGFYQGVHEGERFQVKRITVSVGQSLSLQMHHHRAEHWIVVNGTAKVTRGEDTFLLHENESTYIPPSTKHRLENPGKVPLSLIEVQSGTYLGEDDIVRFEDIYNRT